MRIVVYGYPEIILGGVVTSNVVGDGLYARTETNVRIVRDAESDSLFADAIHGSNFKFIVGDGEQVVSAVFSEVVGNLYTFTSVSSHQY